MKRNRSSLYGKRFMSKRTAVPHFKKIFIAFLATSVLQTLMPANPAPSASSCCPVETQGAASNSCCASKSPRRLLCCTEETEAPASNVAQIPTPGHKSLRAALDLALQQTFTDDDALEYCSINISPDFYACNALLTSSQRYKLSALLLI